MKMREPSHSNPISNPQPGRRPEHSRRPRPVIESLSPCRMQLGSNSGDVMRRIMTPSFVLPSSGKGMTPGSAGLIWAGACSECATCKRRTVVGSGPMGLPPTCYEMAGRGDHGMFRVRRGIVGLCDCRSSVIPLSSRERKLRRKRGKASLSLDRTWGVTLFSCFPLPLRKRLAVQ